MRCRGRPAVGDALVLLAARAGGASDEITCSATKVGIRMKSRLKADRGNSMQYFPLLTGESQTIEILNEIPPDIVDKQIPGINTPIDVDQIGGDFGNNDAIDESMRV